MIPYERAPEAARADSKSSSSIAAAPEHGLCLFQLWTVATGKNRRECPLSAREYVWGYALMSVWTLLTTVYYLICIAPCFDIIFVDIMG